MAKINLKQYGITGTTEVIYNPSYDELYREETRKGLRGYEKGQVTEMGAVNVMTGVYTGRSPKDKFFVMDETTKDTIWWTSPEYKNDNKPVTKKTWKELKKIAVEELSNKKLFVVDTFCGANENTRLKIRFIMEVAWQAHFVKNMFIRPTDEELENYGEPDFVVLNASKAKVKNYKKLGLNSETAVVFNLTEKMQVILNTWYGGEMKKGLFSMMNYYLQECGVKSVLLPALEYMRTDKNAEPDPVYIKDKLQVQLELHPDAEIYITQGYICRNAYGEIDNLQRGGSDYTASLIGAAINASEIQIWTDIDGMHNNDPRIVDKTAPVRHLHFEEAAELAYFGAKILHPTCIQPAKYANIPVRLLNTMDPTAPGTLISNDTEKGKIKAVAAKDNITAIKIKSSRMLLAHGFLRKVFEIFESYQTSIDMICTSEVGVSVSIDNVKHLNEILDDLKKYGTVTVDKDMCIICVVGDLEWENVGFEAKALDAMRDIPVRMISFGGSNYNISFLIRECDKKAALQSLSDALFNEE